MKSLPLLLFLVLLDPSEAVSMASNRQSILDQVDDIISNAKIERAVGQADAKPKKSLNEFDGGTTIAKAPQSSNGFRLKQKFAPVFDTPQLPQLESEIPSVNDLTRSLAQEDASIAPPTLVRPKFRQSAQSPRFTQAPNEQYAFARQASDSKALQAQENLSLQSPNAEERKALQPRQNQNNVFTPSEQEIQQPRRNENNMFTPSDDGFSPPDPAVSSQPKENLIVSPPGQVPPVRQERELVKPDSNPSPPAEQQKEVYQLGPSVSAGEKAQDKTIANWYLRDDLKKGREDPSDIEDCIGCRFVWSNIEEDLGPERIQDRIYDKFFERCKEVGQTPIFFPACARMRDVLDNMIIAYTAGLQVSEICEYVKICPQATE